MEKLLTIWLANIKKNSKLYISRVAWAQNGVGVSLSNKENNFSLSIDLDGIVLTYNYYENDDINLNLLIEYYKNIAADVLKIADATKNVNRLGILNHFTYDTDGTNPSGMLADKLLSVKLNGLSDSFGLRFALKNPTMDSLVRQDTADFTNAIFTFQSEKNQDEADFIATHSLDVNLDYQIYFNPERTFSKSLIDDHFVAYNNYVSENAVNDVLNFMQVSEHV